MPRRNDIVDLMKQQTFGVEIEMGCIRKTKAQKLVNDYFKTKYNLDYLEMDFQGGLHDAYYSYDHKHRKWLFEDDGSAPGRLGPISCEMVTPILTYNDIEDLQEIVRILRRNGAHSGVDFNAGVHIHVGANFDENGGQNATSIRHLTNMITSHQVLLMKAVNVSEMRFNWCKLVDPYFLRNINAKKPKTKGALERIWYGQIGNSYSNGHYDHTRYHMLNLHSIWDKGTIEFRLFEFKRGMHAGELKAWIQWCLAVCQYSKLVTRSSYAPITEKNDKYVMKNWLNVLGLIGDEFETCRKHMLKNLLGDCASKELRNAIDYDELDENHYQDYRRYEIIEPTYNGD